MRRRELIAALGGVAAVPFTARAQQPERMRRVGVLIGVADDAEGQSRVNAFKQGMRGLGWIENRNVRIDARYIGRGAGPGARVYDRAARRGRIRRQLRSRGAGTAREKSGHSHRFAQVIDPVSMGFVQSLARPGRQHYWLCQFRLRASGPNGLRSQRDRAAAYPHRCVTRSDGWGSSGQLGAIQGVRRSCASKSAHSTYARRP